MPRRADITITEQTTDFLDFSLLSDDDNDGEPESGINLSAVDHVELWRVDRAGGTSMVTSANGGALSFPSGWAAAGSIRWELGTADLQAALSPYQWQLKVYRTANSWYYVPEDTRNTIHVREKIG